MIAHEKDIGQPTEAQRLEAQLERTRNTMDRQEILHRIRRIDPDYWRREHPEMLLKEMHDGFVWWLKQPTPKPSEIAENRNGQPDFCPLPSVVMAELEAVYRNYKEVVCPKLMADKKEFEPAVWENIRADVVAEIKDALEKEIITPRQVELLEDEFPEIFKPIVVECRERCETTVIGKYQFV